MVKGVATSIITVAVLMGSLVACSGSDGELAELREELEDVKEQLKESEEAQDQTPTPIPTLTPTVVPSTTPTPVPTPTPTPLSLPAPRTVSETDNRGFRLMNNATLTTKTGYPIDYRMTVIDHEGIEHVLFHPISKDLPNAEVNGCQISWITPPSESFMNTEGQFEARCMPIHAGINFPELIIIDKLGNTVYWTCASSAFTVMATSSVDLVSALKNRATELNYLIAVANARLGRRMRSKS